MHVYLYLCMYVCTYINTCKNCMNCKWNCMKSRVQRNQSTIQEAPLQIRLASLDHVWLPFFSQGFHQHTWPFQLQQTPAGNDPYFKAGWHFRPKFGVPAIPKITLYRCLVDSFPFSKKDFLRKKQFSQIAASEIFLGQHFPTMPFLNYPKNHPNQQTERAWISPKDCPLDSYRRVTGMIPTRMSWIPRCGASRSPRIGKRLFLLNIYLSPPRPNFQTFWEPLGKTILKETRKV